MAHLFTKIYKVFGAEPRCRPGCGRTLSVAIKEQVEKQVVCPLGHCKFKKEIEEAILLSKNPELIQFYIDKTEVLYSETLTISWELLNVKNCILKGFGQISNSGTRQLKLKKTTEFILEFEAFNGDIYNSEELRVNVFPTIELINFSISKSELIKGNSSIINWKSKNVIQAFLSINGIETSVESYGKIEILPDINTKIELKLIGHLNSELIQTKNITIHEPAQIKSFTTDKNKILDKENVTFSYEIENASKVYLSGSSLTNKVDISSTNEYRFAPSILNNHSITQTYYLEVYDKIDNLLPRVPIDIEVFPQPAINSFTLSKEKILVGDEVEINWDVTNFSKLHLQIADKLIDVSVQTSYLFNPKKTVKCKLIVNSLENLKTIESSIQIIQVLNYVEINFSTDKTHTVQTAPITLRWNVKHANSIFMNEPSDIITNSGQRVVHPNETTVYKIFASNDLDETSSKIRINVFPIPVIEKFTFPKLPSLTPKLQETFTGSVSGNGYQHNATILPPQNLNKKSTNKLFDFVNEESTKTGRSLYSKVLSKYTSSEQILNLIKQKINHE